MDHIYLSPDVRDIVRTIEMITMLTIIYGVGFLSVA